MHAWEDLLVRHGIHYEKTGADAYRLEGSWEVVVHSMRNKNGKVLFPDSGMQVIWEDQVVFRSGVVISHVLHRLQRSERIHGRSTEVKVLTAEVARSFFREHHLSGYQKARYRFGLYFGDRLLAAMTFASVRTWDRFGKPYRSVELIQFAVRSHCHVPGGFRKLLAHARHELQPNDIVTYIPIDWSDGEAYSRAGFQPDGETGPLWFTVDWKTGERVYAQSRNAEMRVRYEALANEQAVFQAPGSTKWRLQL